MAIEPGGRRGFFGNRRGEIVVWDLEDGTHLTTWKAHDGRLVALAVDPTGRTIASGSADGVIRLWSAESFAPMAKSSAEPGRTALAYSPDGGTLAVALSDRGRVLLLGGQDLEGTGTLDGHNSPVYSIAFSPDGTRIATGGADGTVRLWDARTTHQVAVFPGNPYYVHSVAFSPDGTCLAGTGGSSSMESCVIKLREAPGMLAADPSEH